MLHDVVAWNAVFGSAQLALAAGLLCRLTVKVALAATIVWSVAVWRLGESLGGIFTGAAKWLSGAPGVVILYALVAILAWPSPAVSVSTPPWRAAACSAPPKVTASVARAVGQFCLPDAANPKPGTWCSAGPASLGWPLEGFTLDRCDGPGLRTCRWARAERSSWNLLA